MNVNTSSEEKTTEVTTTDSPSDTKPRPPSRDNYQPRPPSRDNYQPRPPSRDNYQPRPQSRDNYQPKSNEEPYKTKYKKNISITTLKKKKYINHLLKHYK